MCIKFELSESVALAIAHMFVRIWKLVCLLLLLIEFQEEINSFVIH